MVACAGLHKTHDVQGLGEVPVVKALVQGGFNCAQECAQGSQ